ncbi:hypothetical protein [Nitratifractor sp.]
MKKRPPRGITPGTLAIALIAMTIVVMLAVVKIYLANRIYYESKTINALAREVAALRGERSILRMHVERLKYKSQVTDTIFSMDDDSPSAPAEEPTDGGQTP